MTAPPRDHARIAYDALAPAYDLLTGWHHHDAWTTTVARCARDAGWTGKRVLDVACGTGNALLPLLAQGHAVTGVDVSTEMIAAARRKVGDRATLLVADMRDLPALGTFDLICCLGDALNYLDTEAELVATFAGFRRNLAADGVVAFDVNTLATFRTLYSSLLVVPDADNVVVVDGRGSRDVGSGGAATAQIDRLDRQASGWWSRTRTEHHHRHHPETTLRGALAAAGLACASAYGADASGELERPLDESRHGKAVYTARHEAGAAA